MCNRVQVLRNCGYNSHFNRRINFAIHVFTQLMCDEAGIGGDSLLILRGLTSCDISQLRFRQRSTHSEDMATSIWLTAILAVLSSQLIAGNSMCISALHFSLLNISQDSFFQIKRFHFSYQKSRCFLLHVEAFV